ncbi:MAG: hypothetical protein CVU87_11445 [Firmicutes bacterium HGW-Firmicutes-12]|jgi:uncharacterized protein (DUF1015 family)|nr:MAG: hypothetical protein CVU87_11445 [Firmicutes bacterium HGW-Firmicutes-12]
MSEVKGLTGLRPVAESIGRITCPPYDVIKPGSHLEDVLRKEDQSLYHITLGEDPAASLHKLIENGFLKQDNIPCFYVYEQHFLGEIRTGVLAAVKVSEYAKGRIIRHEKTFDDKVRGRLELRSKTGLTFEPVFFLTRSSIGEVLERVKELYPPTYEFTSDFANQSELDGIYNRIYRLSEDSKEGLLLQELLKESPLYIADGHHRYHASLLNGQSHCLAYICQADSVHIQAYNRVINGKDKFEVIREALGLVETTTFATPPKHHFAIYTKRGSYLMKAENIPEDVVGKLDCSILEKELYPLLGLSHDLIMDSHYFDYYSEADLETMKEMVNKGEYDLAVALHPVSIGELIEVADAGIHNSAIVMPEKSTFFAPKILSGIFIYKHSLD